MNRKLSATFNSLLMIEGQVFGQADFDASKHLVELEAGGKRVPFLPCAEDALERYSFSSRINLDYTAIGKDMVSLPAETSPKEIFTPSVNVLPAWTLSGRNTLQLKISQYEDPCLIEIKRPLSVLQGKEPLAFNVYLAMHRAEAVLHVVFTNAETGQETKRSVSFDPACLGGNRPSGYQAVSIPLPRDVERCDIRMTLEYLEYKAGKSMNPPFLFVAGACVAPVHEQQELSLAEPAILLRGKMHLGAEWMHAHLPGTLEDGTAVSVVIDGETRKILDVNLPKIFIRENYGHTIILESTKVESCLLYMDGHPVSRTEISNGDTVLRLPARCMDGMVHHLSLKDHSGSITYLETLQLVPAIITDADMVQRESAAPFPASIFPQTTRRYASLKQQMAHATEQTDLQQLSYAVSVLEGGHANVKLKPLHFPAVEAPDVSIVIPAHNKIEVTYLALCSLLVAYNRARFEVIVVDDASTDETRELEDLVSGIKVIRHQEAQRFIRSCNAGAKEARGRYIVLLNNDVEVTSGWLDELMAGFDRFDNVGLTGAKLLYPDGKLQDAGGVVWASGNPWNYGNRQNPNEPRFSYARQADYLTGAAIMVPAALWHEVGGLSSYLEPMYFDDTDFAFKIREAGYTTWFIPSAVVYHYEGMTSGTDTSKGFKRFQEINRPKFKRRWAKTYGRFGREGHDMDLEKDRGIVGRVLFVDYTVPRPDRDAGSYAAMEEIRLVQSLGYKVTFMATNMAHLGSYTEDLQKLGVEMIYAPFYMSTAEYLTKHAADFDACYITRYYVAQDVLRKIRAVAPGMKIIFNNADLHFLRQIRAARSENDPAMMETARITQQKELDIIRQVDVVLSYNEVEHSVIQAYTEGETTVIKCPWVVEIPQDVPDLSARRGLSFLGSYRHHPNAVGITWFVQEVMPLLDDVPLNIYGSGITDEIRALQSEMVEPTGFVQDIADAYDRHRIFIAPLLSGAGIKGKVISALAHGIPCLLSPIAAEGIGLRHGHDCLIAETPEDWRDGIRRLMQDDALWMAMSGHARTYMQQAFSFEKGRQQMRKAFEAAGLYRSHP